MPLAKSALLAPHFRADELGADEPTADARIVGNLYALASYLESVRAALGVPLRVASGYRTSAHNYIVGGAATSSHLDGLAADIIPEGISLSDAHSRLSAANLLPWDQFIFYPIEGHIHVGIGPRSRREIRIRLYEGSGGTPMLSPDLIARLGASPLSVLLALIAVAVLLVYALTR
jgi:hypothetical protein